MRLSFSGRVAAALMLLALGGYATAQERLTLRIADQKGGMRSQLEAANALQNLPYDIKWAEFPAAAPLAEALNAGAVDAGIIGDAPLLFALANGAPVKAIAVDKSNPAGTAVLVSPGSTLKSGADLKGKRIATGKGSIGHFVALKALEQAGISPKEVQWVFLGPVDAKVALLNGSVDAWATWEPYTTQMVKTNEGQILVSGKGLLPGNTFLAATDSALNDPQKRAALQDYLQRLAGAERWAYANLDSYGKTLGEIIRFPAEIARAQFANRQSQWQPLVEETVAQQQATADFYLANGLIRTRLDVKPTFDRRFSVPAAEVTSRRRFLQLSGGLALAGVSLPLWAHDMADMAGGDAHPALRLPEPYKIKLAINKSAVCLAPVAVAEQQKIFSKYNLDVEFVNFGSSTDVLLEAIATGKADAGVGMALRWLKALEQGFDVKLTAGTHGGCLNLLTAKDSPFGGLESLKGQTIGVTDMAGPDKNFFAILLKRHGIDPISDVQWKVYPADLLSVALDKREIAAISGSEPFSYRLLETGKYQLIASNMTGDYANLSCCVLGVSGSLARDHKPAAAALTQAILEAHSYAAAHPESVAQSFLAHALNTSEAEVSGILHGQGHGHHAVGEAFVKELTQYAVDLQRVQVIKPGTDPHQFAESIYANVFA
ncbi:aliphatic sulfonate ABC transporter substrate-binding protein [Klebsiella pneumoniae subsp. pneumoniae]|nr:aliphatic sulfonate ABC transporter substrate-binding protein [Klebsiella pneumoniae subsp. pneumoniae]